MLFKIDSIYYFIVSLCGLCCLKSGNIRLHTRGALGVYSLLSSSGYSYLDFSFFSWYESTQLHRCRLCCGNLANSICQGIQVLFLSSVCLLMAILCLIMNSLRHTIFESCNFMAYFGRSISSPSRDMPSKVFGLTSLGPPLDMVKMRRIPPSGSQTGEVDHFL